MFLPTSYEAYYEYMEEMNGAAAFCDDHIREAFAGEGHDPYAGREYEEDPEVADAWDNHGELPIIEDTEV